MKAVIGLLGIGLRAGQVIIGVEAVRRALQAGDCHCIVVAADASQRAREKTVRLARARGIPEVQGPPAQELGAGLGKPPVMVAGVRDSGLADSIRERAAAASGTTED